MSIQANSEEGKALVAEAFGKKKPSRAQRPAGPSVAEETFALQLRAAGVHGYAREFKFHHTRKWRFDFAWPEHKFAVEIEGITGGEGGRHQRIAGFQGDLEKYEAAMIEGWTVYRVSQAMVKKGRAIDVAQRMLRQLDDGTE